MPSNIKTSLIDSVLDEASWLLTHADGLTFEGRKDEACAEWARAASRAEDAACLLDAAGRHAEAAVQRVSAASCLEKLGKPAHAVTLLRAALSAPVSKPFQRRVAELLEHTLRNASKKVQRPNRRGLGSSPRLHSKQRRKSPAMV